MINWKKYSRKAFQVLKRSGITAAAMNKGETKNFPKISPIVIKAEIRGF